MKSQIAEVTKTLHSSFFTSIGNKSRISVSFLFHQRNTLRDESFFAYLCDTKVDG